MRRLISYATTLCLIAQDCHTVQDVWDAIKRLAVRGAPAIGIAAAYGVVLARRDFLSAVSHLATSRPTAVNLFWSLDRQKMVIMRAEELEDWSDMPSVGEQLLESAQWIHEDDSKMCLAIGGHALPLLEKALLSLNGGVLTHCNAGALATGGIGTATAPFYLGHQKGLKFRVFCDETRPLLQGARLTAYELTSAGIDAVVQCDGMAAKAMQEGLISAVFVGADRIAANGDAANKIGTYMLAIAAQYHKIPFYVCAPSSTFDLGLANGTAIPIEERNGNEIRTGFGQRTVPEAAGVVNWAFDVTPASLITAIITEKGVASPVTDESVKKVVSI